MLVPKEMDIEACSSIFETDDCIFLKMIEGKSQNIVMVYNEECGDPFRSPVVRGIICLLNHVVQASTHIPVEGEFSVKLLVDEEQANQFIRTHVESIETECNCTFSVHNTDGIGLARDLVLEIFGEIPNLSLGVVKTACFFQRFSVHRSMIRMIEVLMEDMHDDMSVNSDTSSESPDKVVIEYSVDFYYAAVAVVGEDGNTLRRIQNDTSAIITFEEMKEDPRKLMVYITGNDKQALKADDMVKNLLRDAVRRAHDDVYVSRVCYFEWI